MVLLATLIRFVQERRSNKAALALKEQHGVEIDKRKIEVAEAVRTVGEYEAQITVYAGVKAQMKLSVLAAQ